jgi:hypothetical protein
MSGSPGVSDAALWDAIAPIFSGRAFMRADASWLAGLASRSGHDRMQRLTGSKQAKRLQPMIAGLDRRQLYRLIVRSAINHEQATSALRLTLVANISGPIGALVLLNQFLPGSVQDFLLSLPPTFVIIPLFLGICTLISIIWFVYAGVSAARDLNHLLRLRLADLDDGHSEFEEDEDAMKVVFDLT